MIRSLRRRQLRIVALLAVALPLFLTLALRARRMPPRAADAVAFTDNEAPAAGTPVAASADLWPGLGVRASVSRTSNPSGGSLELEPTKDLPYPDLLVYWVPGPGDSLNATPDARPDPASPEHVTAGEMLDGDLSSKRLSGGETRRADMLPDTNGTVGAAQGGIKTGERSQSEPASRDMAEAPVLPQDAILLGSLVAGGAHRFLLPGDGQVGEGRFVLFSLARGEVIARGSFRPPSTPAAPSTPTAPSAPAAPSGTAHP